MRRSFKAAARLTGWAALVGSVTLAASSVAEPVPPSPSLPLTLTLQEAESLFHQHGFDLVLAEQNVRGAEGDLKAAGAIANPQLSGGVVTSFGSNLNSPVGFNLGINDSAALIDTIFVGKRRLRVDVAKAALEATRLGRSDAERTLTFSLKQAYVQAVTAKASLAVAQDVLASNQQTEKLVQVRYNLGAINEADLAKAKTATLEAAQNVEIATQTLEQAKVALAFLLGVRGNLPNFDVDAGLFQQQPAGALSSATPGTLLSSAQEHRPDLQAERKQVERAESSLALNHRQVFPDIAIGVQYSQQGTGNTAISPPSISFELSAPIPLLYRNEGEIIRAEVDLRTQEVTLARLEAQVTSDVGVGWAAYTAAKKRLDRLVSGGLLEQAAKARDLTRIQYEKGAASLLELLDAQRSYVAVSSEHIQALNDFWNAVFQLEAAVGVEFRS